MRALLLASAIFLGPVAGCAEILGLDAYVEDGPGTTTSGTGGGATTTAAGSTTSASSGSGGGGGAGCGDGEVTPPEECDDGADNGPGKACNASCRNNFCGDGDKGPSESCDDGADNGLGLLKCAPDCSRIIQKKLIRLSSSQPNGNFGGNPIAHADSLCMGGYKAMFAFGDVRRATTVGNELVNPVDWVVQPYTYYYNAQSNPVWLTDDVPLLGVRNAAFVGLENPVRPLITGVSLTGLRADWTTLPSDNCNGWTFGGSYPVSHGVTFSTGIEFIVETANERTCGDPSELYCVEQ